MKRYGQIIGIKPEMLNEYKKLHKAVWPQVLKTITECNIRNYSIYYKNDFLFAYFEYTGENFTEDMKKMATDPVTQKWWDLCMPCQKPVENIQNGEWWATMEEVFHLD